ncbi:MAG: TIR domain-containing protein [Verrucomicrobia bacterium]|nr:TIR domain-containing protein [Verrucomicrobiota bacterium]
MNALRNLVLTRRQLAVLLLAVFVANYLETQVEEWLKTPGVYALGYRINQAFLEIEGGLNFAGGARLERWVVGGFALAYFAVLPLLVVGTAVACGRREGVGSLRVFSLAVAFNYLIALPCFLFVPVPERWAFPGAKATLLSDLLSTRLIELVRPISGLDNCFPSMHVALTVIAVLAAYRERSPWRHSVACLGGTVALSTFFLGIHWLPDMIMGAATAVVCFAAADRVNRRWFREEVPPAQVPRPAPHVVRTRPKTPPPFPAARTAAEKLVFISYRRDGGARLSRVVQMELERRGYPCFLDVDDLGLEHFDERLLREIEKAPNFVLLLAPGSLDRCRRKDDWLRREIAHAFKHHRNVVPLLADGFRFPLEEQLPEDLRDLPRLNGVTYSHEYFAAAFDKLESFLRTK